MIDLITGTPGAGKTLLALWLTEQRRVKEGREVYYSGIADLSLPWRLFGEAEDPKRPHMTDPSEWHKLPDGSIIVIDECQRLYRPRANGSKVPEYVSALETHRHRGLDLVLITQNPLLVDSNVRKLVNEHQHLMRKFGSTWATVHTWKGVKENVDKTRSDSVSREFKYPKEVYKWYKSAEVHTAVFKLPWKVKLFIALPFILAGAVWYAMHSAARIAAPAVPANLLADGGVSGSRAAKGPLTPLQYAESFSPRIAGLPFSAPRYDQLTQPVSVPTPAACISTKSRCKCFTDQATALDVPDSMCRQIALGGLYLDFLQKAPALEGRVLDRPESGFARSPVTVGDAPPPVAPYQAVSTVSRDSQAMALARKREYIR